MSYSPPFECRDHGAQPQPNISYCFRATIKDESETSAPFVFFSPNAEVIASIECCKLVKEQGYSDPMQIPPPLEAITGKKHIFQFHFNSSSKKGSVEFIFDGLFDNPETPAGRGKRSLSQDFGNTEEMNTKKLKTGPLYSK